MKTRAIVFDAYGTLYDIQSVAAVTDEAFPGRGELITQVWRLKQLEYTWLRTLMGRYADFGEVTREALAYTLGCLGIPGEARVIERLMDKYLRLDLYADARETLARLSGRKLAILSNGSPAMLEALVRHSGLDGVLAATLSVDELGAYKPRADVYGLVERHLGVPAGEVLFVSSNAFDACGAKSAGLRVAWIERVTAPALAGELAQAGPIGPLAMFKALRLRMEPFGFEPDHRVRALSELPALVGAA